MTEAATLAKLSAMGTVFTVADVSASLAFYKDVLGFTVEFEHDDPPIYAIVRRGAAQLHLRIVGDDEESKIARGRSTLYVFTDDVDALHAELAAKGCVVEGPPQTYSYGMREMVLRDLDGNRLVFGADAPGSR